MDKTRQVRYNSRRSSLNEDAKEWFFLIVNENREILEIQQRIYDLFSPIIEEGQTINGLVKGYSLRYKLINFESKKNVELYDLDKLYLKIVKDNKLYTRKSRDGLENYLSEKFK